jgi:hypothetical protein
MHAMPTVPILASRVAVSLTRPSSGPLTTDDDAALEQFATPHAAWLASRDRGRQAAEPSGAVLTEELGHFQLDRVLGEPQVRIVHSARQVLGAARRERIDPRRPVRAGIELNSRYPGCGHRLGGRDVGGRDVGGRNVGWPAAHISSHLCSDFGRGRISSRALVHFSVIRPSAVSRATWGAPPFQRPICDPCRHRPAGGCL